jgi:hypothetical protein
MTHAELGYLLTTYVEINGRRVNVPKGTPGSVTKALQNYKEPESRGISPEALAKAKRKATSPANMDTVDFLLWVEEASVQELEAFSKEGQGDSEPPYFPSDPVNGDLFFDGKTGSKWWFNGVWLRVA